MDVHGSERYVHAGSDGFQMKLKKRKRKTYSPLQGAICVISGDETIRYGLRMVLSTLGARVVAFSTAEQFIDQLNGQEPAILITDINLPGASGLELLEALDREGIEVPAIGLAKQVGIAEGGSLAQGGFAELIEKPFVYWSVVDRVHEILRHPR
jgi:two-component system nitrogen regulation response regulator GlnG